MAGGERLFRERGGLAGVGRDQARDDMGRRRTVDQRCGPALQRPWKAMAIGLPGWSMLPEENFIGEPIACMNAPASAEPAGYGNE